MYICEGRVTIAKISELCTCKINYYVGTELNASHVGGICEWICNDGICCKFSYLFLTIICICIYSRSVTKSVHMSKYIQDIFVY